MVSFDTNIAVYAANKQSVKHREAQDFLQSLAQNKDVAICELMLVELFLKLCNRRIFPRPLSPRQAAEVCRAYRSNRGWALIENAAVMDEVWERATIEGFAIRRIIDVRLGLTLRHHGVTQFATANVKDFEGLGFEKVWNPLEDGGRS